MNKTGFVPIEFIGKTPKRFRRLGHVAVGDTVRVDPKDVAKYIATGMFKSATGKPAAAANATATKRSQK